MPCASYLTRYLNLNRSKYPELHRRPRRSPKRSIFRFRPNYDISCNVVPQTYPRFLPHLFKVGRPWWFRYRATRAVPETSDGEVGPVWHLSMRGRAGSGTRGRQLRRGQGRRLALPVVGVVAALAAVLLGLPGVSAAATSGHQQSIGKPWPLPSQPTPHRHLATLGDGSGGAQAATTAASAQARATGKPVQVGALTTQTTTVTAEPNGTEVATNYVYPVRVRDGRQWVPVNTGLRRVAGGRLASQAVPGDAVSFSGGGSGPMAVISASGTHLALYWPGRLPAPVVAGSSATYRNVLPGVDLVLTATSEAAGGFSEVLVVGSAVAARDPGLAGLALRVATSGTAPLREANGGGLTAVMTRGRGSYVAAPSAMWDSASVPLGGATARSAYALARSAGAGLAAAGTGPRSSAAGPAGGARLAGVGTRVLAGGTALVLVPDERMLTSPSTRFPVYIDPGFTAVTGTGGTQDTDVVQSECPSPHYNDSFYSAMPVGEDNFQAGPCQDNDTDYALYQVGIPSEVFASQAVLINATFQATEVFTSTCASTLVSLTVTWIGPIYDTTGWPGSGPDPRDVDATKNLGPDPGSCDSVEDTADTESVGFTITTDIARSTATNITLRLWEPNDANDLDHKQFSKNPDLQVVYTDTPNTPTGEEEAATNGGTGSLDCDTSPANPPVIGKTDATNGPYLLATYSDPDGASVQANIRYWDYTTSSAMTTVNDAINDLTASNVHAAWQMPASYTSGLPDGSVIAWQAQAETGSASVDGANWGPYSSAWSNTCYFAVYPQAPDPPTVTENFTGSQPVGSDVTFTITQSSDPAAEFVWSVDQTPPTAGTVPTAQTCTTASAEAHCGKITNGSATLTIPVPTSGPHDLFVYEVDAGGNESADANPVFTGSGDPNVQYVSGTSLQANFTAALGAGQPFDNTMISTAAGSSGTANGDGGGQSLDEAQLTAAGWQAGKPVTVDGATFTLPDFGTAGSGPDNLLSANQTIGAGPSGARGGALVFLATSTDADAIQVPGTATGSPDSGVLAGDTTAPAVMGGTPVSAAGVGCDGNPAFDTNASCAPATGTIAYAAGCPNGTSQSYTLTAPDWIEGPSDIAALVLPDWDTAGGQLAGQPKIYAFAVPVDPSCTVTSVTLPDVGDNVDDAATYQPALHILGLALRNTTTATPEADGTQAAAPSGQAWTGAFESPIEDAYTRSSSAGDQTFRIDASVNISAPAGADVRIRLSDPGFLSQDGTGPLVIGAATIANSYDGAIPGQTPVALTFGSSDSTSVTVPEGSDIYSNPLTLPFAITQGKGVLVSIWLENSSLPVLPVNSWESGGLTWVASPSTPNETEDTTGTPFTGPAGSSNGSVPVLTGVDVTTPAESSAATGASSPGAPTVVVAGDNLIDAWSSSAASDSLDLPSQRVAGQLAGLLPSLAASADDGLAGYGVVDAGMQSNQVLADGASGGGISLLARVDADILTEPDVGTVVLDEGLEDVLRSGGSASLPATLENAYTVLEDQLSAFGITVITADLTPCSGYSNSSLGDSCSSAVDSDRTSVNGVIDGGGDGPNCPADFDAAVTNGDSPEALASGYGTADDVNLTLGASGGYAKVASVVVGSGPSPCNLAPNSFFQSSS
jgi:hypothetical protein